MEKNKCKKCGQEIDGDSIVCMYCGASIPKSQLSEETVERMKKNEKDTYTSPNASSIKAIGAFVMILGILADIISMFLISSSDFESFGVITIIGTICFFIGIVLFSNG